MQMEILNVSDHYIDMNQNNFISTKIIGAKRPLKWCTTTLFLESSQKLPLPLKHPYDGVLIV